MWVQFSPISVQIIGFFSSFNLHSAQFQSSLSPISLYTRQAQLLTAPNNCKCEQKTSLNYVTPSSFSLNFFDFFYSIFCSFLSMLSYINSPFNVSPPPRQKKLDSLRRPRSWLGFWPRCFRSASNVTRWRGSRTGGLGQGG